MMPVTQSVIQKFLAGQRLAVIGVSRNQRAYSRRLVAELQKHGYEVLAVNPRLTQLAGVPCFKNIAEITPPPERAIIILPEDQTAQAVRDCAAAQVKDIWLHRQEPRRKADAEALRVAQEGGLNLITGWCLFMFLPHSALIHKCHGGLLKIFGQYPK